MPAGGGGGGVGGVTKRVWHEVPGEATAVRQAEGVNHKRPHTTSPLGVRQPGCAGGS